MWVSFLKVIIGHWPMMVEGEEVASRVWIAVMTKLLLETASERQLYFIVTWAGCVRVLRGMGREG